VLYVEPLYLQAEQGELPELKRVILSNGDDIVMEQSLDRALAALVGGTARQWRDSMALPTAGDTLATTSLIEHESASGRSVRATRTSDAEIEAGAEERLDAARSAFLEGQRALRAGDWAAFGEAQRRLEQVLEERQPN
jgi:uncharacterized membrane protein (UPF0182 family)